MFTNGRIIFTLIFIVVFIGGMIYAYRKDLKQVKAWFGQPYKVLLALLAILMIYVLLSRMI